MVAANLGPHYDLAQRLDRMERNIAHLATAPILQNASSTQSDGSLGLQIAQDDNGASTMRFYYGPNTPGAVQDVNGQWPILVAIGQVLAAGVPVGSDFIVFRPNGQAILSVGSTTGGTLPVGFNAFDATGNPILAADETSGFGLADPWIPYPVPMDTNIAKWPSTTAATLTNISNSNGFLQHPVITFTAQGYAPAGTTGVFAMYVNGAQLGSTWTASGAITTTIQTVTVPAPSWHSSVSLQVFAQVTAGTGAASCQVTQIYGRQT